MLKIKLSKPSPTFCCKTLFLKLAAGFVFFCSKSIALKCWSPEPGDAEDASDGEEVRMTRDELRGVRWRYPLSRARG